MSDALGPVTSKQWSFFLRQAGSAESIGEPVAESALAGLESRLGRSLPTDYRNFLATTDGYAGDVLYRMYPAAEVGWARDVMPELMEVRSDFDDVVKMLQRCAVVGDDESNTYYLIDPVPHGDGWTAIEWWTTPSETTDYPSFGALAAALGRSEDGCLDRTTLRYRTVNPAPRPSDPAGRGA